MQVIGGGDSKKGDIMFGGRCGDIVMRRIAGRRSFLHILERNADIVGGDKDEGITIIFHGNYERTV